jgi:hypothetical protein
MGDARALPLWEVNFGQGFVVGTKRGPQPTAYKGETP